jgi:hypothetical protein
VCAGIVLEKVTLLLSALGINAKNVIVPIMYYFIEKDKHKKLNKLEKVPIRAKLILQEVNRHHLHQND